MKSVIASALFVGSSYAAGGGEYDYGHTGADWRTSYEMCALPDNSPIHIHSGQALFDSNVCGPQLNWTVDYSVHDWKVLNSRTSISVTPLGRIEDENQLTVETTEQIGDHEYTTRTLPANSIARLPNYFLPEGSMNEEFCLHSFHFHWGAYDDEGSEHWLDDVQYPLEVHFVHYSCARNNISHVLGKYPDASATLGATEHGEDRFELAVVGIFFDITEWDNPAFEAILSEDILEEIRYPGGSAYTQNLFLQDLIPQGVFTDGYYSYEGSLTTPPCTDIVRWHVSNAKSYIGKAQMARFRELMMSHNQTQAPNFRETVYNEHPVYACMNDEVDEVNATERAIVWIWSIVVIIMMCVLGGVCYLKSKRAPELPPPPAPKRQRLFSSSGAHGDGHGHGHGTGHDDHGHGHH